MAHVNRLLWSDDFDGPAGAPVNPAVWSYDVGDGSAQGNPGWGNGELQHYTSGTENAALDGRGNLVIEARYNGETGGYTSARMLSKEKLALQYGRIETRLRVPRGAGLWPAFWALGATIDSEPWPACGEIDVMEHVGREPRRVFGTLHGPGYSGDGGYGGTTDLDRDVADDFHVFAVDWRPRHIAWTLDGTIYMDAEARDLAPHEWIFDQPFFLLLNLAVGGHFGGTIGPDTAFPQQFVVDYVRAYEQDGVGAVLK